jgi:phenylpropionate dioxygenase-like ring-hydroxylating dioxygenase large terminal subunit
MRCTSRVNQLQLFAVWHGLVFVNLDVEAALFESRLGDIDRYLQAYEPESFSAVSQGEIETWSTNWKLAMENAMESYHLFKVHEQTLEVFLPTRDAYYIAGSSEWSLTGGLTQRKKGLLEKMFSEEIHDHYVLVSLPPSFVGVLSYGSLG